MPPKKKGKGKGKGKKKDKGEDVDSEEPLTLEQQNLFLRRQVESLKHRLSKFYSSTNQTRWIEWMGFV